MQIQISGQHLDIGDSLRNHIKEKVTAVVTKFFDNPVKAHINISKSNHHNTFRVDIMVNEGTGGRAIKSEAEDYDAHKSVDEAITKIEEQLRRYKSKIKNHHKKALNDSVADNINADMDNDLADITIASDDNKI